MKLLLFPLLILLPAAAGAQPYFQQKVDTRIDVRLDDQAHFLHGFETISYVNNSPDTLEYIYLHLWPNAYSSDRTRFAEQQVANGTTAFYFSKIADRGYIDSLDIRVDGVSVTPISAEGLPDIARVDLPKPLFPGASIELTTPFRVKIPLVFSRLGHKGQAYYISQWFPKPAVYDRKGWHPLPYTDQGEFYSEIGGYDVTITLPKNYVVMATGNCLTESENAWLDSLSRLPLPPFRSTARLKSWRDSIDRIPPSSTGWKTLHFREEQVHDFALFADKRFVVRKDTVQVAAGAGVAAHEVIVYSAFLPSGARHWRKATDYLKTTVRVLSEEVGPYPYKTIKAVEGQLSAGGGMEYPTVALIDQFGSSATVKTVLTHEAGHNWFYGILASNERDHAWMDEGFNTFYEHKITGAAGKKRTARTEDVLYFNAAGTRSDQALSRHSADYTKINYGLDAYYKSALMLRWLEGYMGADTFRAAMQDYYAEWRHRHPYPEDLQPIFQRHLQRPVAWFFRDALNTDRGIDFALKNVAASGDSTSIRVRNNSGFPAPVRINAFKGDVLSDSAWTLPFARDTSILLADYGATSWRIGDEVPDYYGLNNRAKSSGMLRGLSFRVRPGLGLGRREAAELYVLPALGYNVYDGFMAGLLLHNFSVPENRLRFALAPMYGFRSREFAGAGSIGYWIYPRGRFREIVAQVDVKTFQYDSSSMNISQVLRTRYIKVAPSLSFQLKQDDPRSPVSRTVLLKAYGIWEEDFRLQMHPDSLNRPIIPGSIFSHYALLRYTHRNDRSFNPFSYVVDAQFGPGFTKLSMEGRLRIDYQLKGKALHLRGYAGKYFNSAAFNNPRFWLTSSYSAANDYLYDGAYFGRSENAGQWSRQVSIQEGGGKIPTPRYALPLGRSDDWLVGINLKSDLPLGWLPVRLYFDASTYADAGKISPTGSRFLYSGGIELHALQDVFLVHIPLVMSPDYRDYLDSVYPGKRLANSISFAIQFQNINWLRTFSTAMKYIVK